MRKISLAVSGCEKMEFNLQAQKFILEAFMKSLLVLFQKLCFRRYSSLSKLEDGKIVELHRRHTHWLKFAPTQALKHETVDLLTFNYH